MIVLTLPYPLSANRYWRKFPIGGKKGGREIITRSAEAKDYIEAVQWIARQAGIVEPLAGRMQVDIELYPARPQDWAKRARLSPLNWDDDVRCIDLDNARKVLNDALKGIVFEDDRWIWCDSGKRMEPDGEARVVVRVTPLAIERVQGELIDAPPLYMREAKVDPPEVPPAAEQLPPIPTMGKRRRASTHKEEIESPI